MSHDFLETVKANLFDMEYSTLVGNYDAHGNTIATPTNHSVSVQDGYKILLPGVQAGSLYPTLKNKINKIKT